MSEKSRNKVFITCTIIAVLVIALTMGYISQLANKDNINKEISSRGGTVISIESRLMDIGPFYVRANNQSIYKVDYKDKEGNVQEAWVRTGVLDDWVWDYKK